MGAAAAKEIVDRHGVEGIRTVLFATESGVDQSKAAGCSCTDCSACRRTSASSS
ncbi:hypothetical protein P9139_21040 [Curtobacterium flaccumfaciens]|nr:hypothetical protein P9139_21040 [Curtobacterium flaccumfaciens]